MDITSPTPKDKNSISSYGPDGFKIGEDFYKDMVILSPEKLEETKIEFAEELTLDDLKKILSQESEILLIGTGSSHKIISDSWKTYIKNSYPNLCIDEMTSAAACRTYNILLSEDRNVVAILQPTL